MKNNLKDAALSQDSWRLFKILSEFVDGFETLTHFPKGVAFFGSARLHSGNPYYEMATEIAYELGKKGFGIMTGGGPGIMEAANKGAKKANTPSCGICVNLPFEEKANPYIDKEHSLSLRYFFVRKVLFVRYAKAFIVLPGGMGTLDELFEALTLMQTDKSTSFPVFLVGKSYWQGLISWLKASPLHEKCITKEDIDRLIVTDDPLQIVSQIETFWS